LAAWPVAARAQQPAALRRVDVLLVGLSSDSKKAKHFRLGLRDTGYAEGAQRSLRMAVSERDYDQVLRLDRSGIKSAS
jgi:hypothetical protein